jgi:hypothetical protein
MYNFIKERVGKRLILGAENVSLEQDARYILNLFCNNPLWLVWWYWLGT